ncbi:MAG: hypothetical protein OEW97_02600, partial [Gammaproteobacteria bacterium]|nr:hypothetical protein [Gammaproteobacteria bacterium]
MNHQQFSSFSLSNIGQSFTCKNSSKAMDNYLDHKNGVTFEFLGFVCSTDEHLVLLAENDGQPEPNLDY